MDQDEWQKIEAAFQHALSLDGDARERLLNELDRQDPRFAARLRDLLIADGRSDAELRSPIEATVESLAKESADPWIGRKIGAWTLTKRLAGGGMGAVFLAERSDRQYSQTVAVKLMAAPLLATEAINRFVAERQILANLNHPYIAKLIDGGSTLDGVPYLVMEYVDGLPIDDYCDTNRLDVDIRLELIRRVCEAVDYAHRNLVVHRDLKPSNILVDHAGNPKLLDFGIAKLLEAGVHDQTIVRTREGVRAMTPEYASPEQVRGEPVSVATDVYSLGVLLFRLMTGASPYGVTTTTPAEYERAILEVDPRKPSTVVTSPSGQLRVGELRDTSVERLRRSLQGDLDNIVLKALQKDPERRYATASALSEDIGRYLANEPVAARGDDWWYKSRKFAIRNARALLLVALVLGTVAGLVTYYTFRLAGERDRANLAAAQASQVSEFLAGLFSRASPHAAKGEPVTAVDLLRQGRERIEMLGDQPELQARLMGIMARSSTALGHYDESIPMLERVLAMEEARATVDALALAEANHDLAEAHRQTGDLGRAERYERRAIALAGQALGPADDRVASLTARLGVILFDAGKAEEALAIEQRALDIMLANGTGESSEAIDVRGNMANALARLGRLDESAALHRETIELSSRVDGELAPNTIIRISNLGLVQIRQGELEAAVRTFEDAIERGRKVWPADHQQLAFMIGSNGAALKRLGRMDEALAAYEEALEIIRRGLGTDSARYVAGLRGLGSVQMDMARYQAAEATFVEALARADRLDGGNADVAVQVRLLLGQLEVDRRRFAVAERYLRTAKSQAAALGAVPRLILDRELGEALSSQGRFDEAEPLLLDAMAGQEHSVGADNPVVLPFLAALAGHYRRAGATDESLLYAQRIGRIVAQDSGPITWTSALALAEAGRTLDALGRPEGRDWLRRAHAELLRTFGPGDPRVLELKGLVE